MLRQQVTGRFVIFKEIYEQRGALTVCVRVYYFLIRHHSRRGVVHLRERETERDVSGLQEHTSKTHA